MESARWYKEQQQKEARRRQSEDMKALHDFNHLANMRILHGWLGDTFFDHGVARQPIPRMEKAGLIFKRK